MTCVLISKHADKYTIILEKKGTKRQKSYKETQNLLISRHEQRHKSIFGKNNQTCPINVFK